MTDYEFVLQRLVPGGDAPDGPFLLTGRSAVRVGRAAADTELVVPHEAVSRKHAILTESHGVWTIEDLKSSNGTFVNGAEIAEPVRLNPGDEIRFAHDGPAFTFERRPAAAEPAPDEPDAEAAQRAAAHAAYERYLADRAAYDRAVAERAAYDRAVAERALYDRAIAAGQTPQQAMQHVQQFRAQAASAQPQAPQTPAAPVPPRARKMPGGAMRKGGAPTLSEAMPFLSGGGSILLKPSLLVPILYTGLTGLWLFAKSNDQDAAIKAHDVAAYMHGVYAFDWTLGIFLVTAIAYGVIRLLGTTKPWWVLVSSAVWTFLGLFAGFPFALFAWPIYGFSYLLGGREDASAGFVAHFISFFLGTGLSEELFKAVPVFAAVSIAKFVHTGWGRKAGAFTAMDAIAVGVASATGFTCLETMSQYVPDMIKNFYDPATATDTDSALENAVVGAGQGLQLLIPRIIGEIASHMAWTGYFAYMIGLAFQTPGRRAWLFILIGWTGAAFLHGLWDTFGDHTFVLALVAIVSMLVLVGSIRRARFASGVSLPIKRKPT